MTQVSGNMICLLSCILIPVYLLFTSCFLNSFAPTELLRLLFGLLSTFAPPGLLLRYCNTCLFRPLTPNDLIFYFLYPAESWLLYLDSCILVLVSYTLNIIYFLCISKQDHVLFCLRKIRNNRFYDVCPFRIGCSNKAYRPVRAKH